jgi:hypothetical protein
MVYKKQRGSALRRSAQNAAKRNKKATKMQAKMVLMKLIMDGQRAVL